MSDDRLLVASDVHVRFEGVRAVEGVTLTVRPRTILGLIGPNGAGKTTLVNAMTGFHRATRGRVTLGEKDITSLAPEKISGLGIARTFQSARVFPRMTVLENVEVAALTRGRRRIDVRARASEIIASVGLSRRATVLAGALPFGEERMVGIARALALEPKFLLMDEPAAGLNEDETDSLAKVILRIRQERHCGVLLIEHDMRIVMSICDSVHVLNSGQSLYEGTPAEVQRHETVLAAYLGRKTRERVVS